MHVLSGEIMSKRTGYLEANLARIKVKGDTSHSIYHNLLFIIISNKQIPMP